MAETKAEKSILYLGWAPLAEAGRTGGGYNIVVEELSREVANRCSKVYYIASGRKYSLTNLCRPYIKFEYIHNKVKCFSLFNSSVRAPGIEMRPSEIFQEFKVESQILIDFIRLHSVAVVHIHSFEGWHFNIVSQLRASFGKALRIFYTAHDYYPACPRTDLFKLNQVPCIDWKSGGACAGCLSPEKRKPLRYLRHYVPSSLVRVLSPLLKGSGARHQEVIFPNVTNHEVICGIDTPHNGPNWRLNAKINLNMLNKILCPSEFCSRVFAKLGVDEDKLIVVPNVLQRFKKIGANIANAEPKPVAKKIRLGFIGNADTRKGLSALLSILNQDDFCRNGIESLTIWGAISKQQVERWNINCIPVLVEGSYKSSDLSTVHQSFDIGVFPHICLDNNPLTLQECVISQKAVLVSELGGAAEIVKNYELAEVFSFKEGNLAMQLQRIIAKFEQNLLSPSVVDIDSDKFVSNHLAMYEM